MTCRFLNFAVLAVAALIQAAQAQEQGATSQTKAAGIADDKPLMKLPRTTSIPFDLQDNLVTIDTIANGLHQRAVLDSGSGALVVDRGFAREHGLAIGKSVGDVAGAGEQAQQLHPVIVPRLVVGPFHFEQMPAYAVNLEHLTASAGFPIGLLIGAPAFKHGSVKVDYKQRRVTFGPSGSLGNCASPIPLTIVHDVPVVKVELKVTPDSRPISLNLVVDLGTRHRAAIIGGQFVRSEAGKAMLQSSVQQQVGHGSGGKVGGSVSRVHELRFGSARFADIDVALTSGVAAFDTGVIDGSIGVPLWKNGAITFDYPAKTLCIEN